MPVSRVVVPRLQQRLCPCYPQGRVRQEVRRAGRQHRKEPTLHGDRRQALLAIRGQCKADLHRVTMVVADLGWVEVTSFSPYHSLQNSAWADGSLAEVAEQMGNMI